MSALRPGEPSRALPEGGGHWEDFEVGQFHPTTSRTISEDDHRLFCRVVGYDAPLFNDEAYARQAGFGGLICPSHLIMSFSSAMTGRLFSGTLIAIVGADGGRFLAPVRPGDTIATEVEVVGKRPSSDAARGLIVFRDHVRNHRDELVFQMDKTVLLKRRRS